MNQRYYSLDVFRGITVALMILVNNPGSWSYIYGPLKHAEWHGCTPTDLVFPFFLFAVGNAVSFVMPRFEKAGTVIFLRKVFKRALLIFLIGLLLNWSPFVRWENDSLVWKYWENVRIMGVLQRIALCYLLAALTIYFFKFKGAFFIGCLMLLLYWLLCIWLGGSSSPFSLQGYFGTLADVKILGISHLYKGAIIPFDPEGLAGTASSTVQVIFGYLVGIYIQQKGKTYVMLSHLFVIAALLIFAGLCWNTVFPINKKIWSSSYVLYSTGLSITVLSLIIYLIEFRNSKGCWASFFDVFGKNPLFIFVLSGLLPRLLGLIRIPTGYDNLNQPIYLSPLNWFYKNTCQSISTDYRNGSLLYALCMLGFYWLVVYILDKRKIYIKV